MRVSPRGSFAFLCIVSGKCLSHAYRYRFGSASDRITSCLQRNRDQSTLCVSQCRSDRGATSFLVSRSLYCGGNDSHPPPIALYKAIRFVVTAVWLCARRSSFP